MEQNGSYFTIGDNPDLLEFYYKEKMHLENPYNSHPDLIRSGVLLVPDLHNLHYKKSLHTFLKLRHGFIFIQNTGDAVESFYFDVFIKDQMCPSVFFANLGLLRQFTNYFKREAKSLLEGLRNDSFNIKQEKGLAFLKIDPSNPLSNKDPNIERLVKIITPLSRRERQCLQLFKEGKSAQATGAILGISQRTVEFYFDNIKNKLDCHSKSELLEW